MVVVNSAQEYELSVDELHEKRKSGESLTLLDIRKPAERDLVALEDDLFIPMGELPEHVEELEDQEEPIVVYCHHGVRSLQAAQYLHDQGLQNVFSLAGGIDAWARKIDTDLPTY